jgi:ADP-heptose:LPS heptosyltransferase
MKYLIKLRNLLNYFIYLVIDSFLPAKGKTNPNTLLIIRLDAIGDYLLFRNFLIAIKSSKKYKNYKVTLCGNIIWKTLAEEFDKDAVDEFIWIDRSKFYKNIRYKFDLLKKIRKKGFETAVVTTYSREILYDDLIINSTRAKNRIGSEGSNDSHVKWKRNLFTDKYYTRLIPTSAPDIFEFYYNKIFFDILLEEPADIKAPQINTSQINLDFVLPMPYVVLFPGASRKEKTWSHNNFKEIAEFLINEFSYNIIITGGEKEKQISPSIYNSLPEGKVLNLTSKTTLPGLAKIINESEMLVSNETAAVHIAASVNKTFICISNGERFGRFHPYPQEIFDKAYYIYPPEIMNNLNNIELLKNKYRFSSDLNINEIKPQTVKDVIKKILG